MVELTLYFQSYIIKMMVFLRFYRKIAYNSPRRQKPGSGCWFLARFLSFTVLWHDFKMYSASPDKSLLV
ncbi:hypothetical protein FSC05_01600 [Acinetobacter indicus]|uniref:Uncharacterized protein n=1 Tax=Acinetobacter indicus TaxID=756892 RepID=A0A6C0XZ58_9GAMM|nr:MULTISPECIES: hypothetical protein [Acinetobacter]MDM1284714.1 hypothetical protein [Acinetobacter indicus]QFS18394.1 hypothetical protein FHP22_13390 [Acinetobacter indicus]QIC69179.1 hypothetical protein FSC09_01465 [Acinetobacter indicus]QIC72518.1 hypothetical protein FSC05_01600 [Acinetobacter indicus]QIC77005.1 hypothetical protein FSC17_11690 [Acinetobacter indicus]